MSRPPITLEQLRVFCAVADEGGFSAAARRLDRTQAAVSYTIAALEKALGVPLFDRSGYRPVKTEAARVLLPEVRAAVVRAERVEAVARAMEAGIEGTLAIALDAVLPVAWVTDALTGFQQRFPSVRLDVRTEAMWSVSRLVASEVCDVGICGPLPSFPEGLVREQLCTIPFIAVACRTHPLAEIEGPIPDSTLNKHVQLVFGDRDDDVADKRGPGLGRGSKWRLVDLHTRYRFLCAGLGWGYLPSHWIDADVAGRQCLKQLSLQRGSQIDTWLSVIHRSDRLPGPAARWLLEKLGAVVAKDTAPVVSA